MKNDNQYLANVHITLELPDEVNKLIDTLYTNK